MFALTDLDAQRERLRTRIRANVTIDGAGCWLWLGARSGKGYVQTRVGGEKRAAHRVAYEAFVGPISPGLELDHLCKTRHCVNPLHLEPVTHEENIRRSDAGKPQRDKRECANGHAFTPENTYYSMQRGRQRRHCRTCRREASRRFIGFTGKGRWPSENLRID